MLHGADIFSGDIDGGTTASQVNRGNDAAESGTAPVAGAAVTAVAGVAATGGACCR